MFFDPITGKEYENVEDTPPWIDGIGNFNSRYFTGSPPSQPAAINDGLTPSVVGAPVAPVPVPYPQAAFGGQNFFSTPFNAPTQANPFASFQGVDPAGIQQQAAILNTTFPWLQARQNSFQYGQDFDEAVRRYNEQFGETQRINTAGIRRDNFAVASRNQLPNFRFVNSF